MLNAIWLVPLAPLCGSLICMALIMAGRRKDLAHLPAIAGMAIAAVVAAVTYFESKGGVNVALIQSYTWLQVGTINIPVSLRLDGLSLTHVNVVAFISLLVAIYSSGYMKGDAGYARFFALISAFVFCMSMLVLVGNLLLLYAFWEGVGLCSYLLIGFWYHKPSAAKAAMKAFLVNRLADCAFLAGIITLWYGVGLVLDDSTNTLARLDYDAIFNAVPLLAAQHPDLLGWVGCFILVGAIGKSAQFPFHVWLPDAMEGPTPVSALIHAATMVTAGIYLLARMSPLLAEAPTALMLAGWLGAITAVLGGVIALFQNDLKRVLAYSTVSQLGYMFLAFGAGLGEATLGLAVVAAMFHLITHAFFKAQLFLTAGNVMHAMGDVIDMRQFGGLRSVLPRTHILFLLGAIALVGLPPLAGFWSKESILGLLLSQLNDPVYGATFACWLALGLLAAFLTAIYTSKAYFKTFHGEEHWPHEAGEHPHEASTVMIAPLWVLAVGTVFSGVVIFYFDTLAHFILPMPFLEVAHEHHHESWLLVVLSIAIAAGGVLIGRWWGLRKTDPQTAKSPSAFAIFAENRFYLDELFYNLLVAPFLYIASVIAAFDMHVIDSLTRYVASLPETVGNWIRLWQSGPISRYAAGMVLGIIALLTIVYLRS